MAKKPRLAAVLALLVASGAVADSTVSGVVRGAQSSATLPNMVVDAYDTAGFLQGVATSDSSGRYELPLRTGNYRLLVYDTQGVFATTFDGNADSFETTPVVTIGAQALVVNFAMQIGGRISGTIAAAAGGSALGGTTVDAYNLSGTRRGSTQTDGSGAYSIVVPPGQYKIVAYDSHGFYAPRFYPDIYGFDAASAVVVTSSATAGGKNIDLENAAHLGGTIVDFDSGTPLPGMTVYAYDDEGVNVAQSPSDASGKFAVNVPGGAYRMVATDRGMTYATGFFGDAESFDQSLAVSVAPSQSRLDLAIPLHRGGKVAGHITGNSAAALPNVTVAAYNGDGSQRTTTQTDSSGAYTLVLPGGTFRIAAYDMQLVWATQFYRAENAFAEADDLSIVPSATASAIDFALVHAGKIAGTVKESGSGLPAFSVGIVAYDGEGNAVGNATTDASGVYTLALSPGSYRIVAFDPALRYATAYGGGKPNYDASPLYTVSSDQTIALDFTVWRGVVLSGRVTDSANHPLSGIEIGVLDLSGNRVATAASLDGAFSVVLLPGSYKLIAADAAGSYSTSYYSEASTLADARTVVIQAGVTPPAIAFVLGPRGRHRAVSH